MGRLNKYFFLIPLYIILGSLIVAILWYGYLSYSLVPHKEKKLWEITLEHEEKINTYLLQQQTNTQTLASDDTTATFLATHKSHTKKDDDQYQEFLDTQKPLLGFKNIFLIDNNSTIVFSTVPSIIGKKITENTAEYSSLKKSYERAFMALAPDFAYFDYEPLINERALFITIPVIKDKKMVGILAYQFDQEKIYQMINQYIGLGTTGEIALAQQEDTYAVFVAPSRHDPDLAFKKRDLFTKAPISVQASALGGQGTGIATDYRDKKVVAAWTFITKINWGMVVKMDYTEVMEPLTTVSMIIIFLFFVFIFWLFITEYFFHRSIILQLKTLSKTKGFKKIPSLLRNPFFLFFIIATIFIIKNIIYYEYTTISTTQKSKAEILDSVDKDVDRIQSILNRISFTTQSLADDLHLQRLSEEDIKQRLSRDIAENTIIQSITIMLTSNSFKKNTLDTVTVYKTSRTEQNMIIEEKYKNEEQLNTIIKSEWFAKTVEKGSYWLKPTKNKNHTNNNTSSYSLIIRNKQKEIIGLVSLVFKLEPLERIAAYNSLNRIGYSILLAQDGTFLFHPIESLAMEKTFSQFAQESGNKELARLAQEALNEKSLLATYREENTNQLMWLYTKPIPINNWILGTIFPIADITLQSDVIRHSFFWLLAYCILASLCLCSFFYSTKKISIFYYILLINAILIIGLLITWRIIQVTSTIDRTKSIIITDQSSLDKFIDDINEETKRKHEDAPINVPCGLLLYALDIPDPEHVSISGYIWNKYNEKLHQNISHTILLPQATRMEFGKPTSSITDDWETIIWHIKGIIAQEQNYTAFPFDKQQIKIIIEHQDIQKNIFLTPDLSAYKKLSPESTPGINKEFSLAGFVIEQTFFNYHMIDTSTNFGFKEYGKVTDHFQLMYNIVISRNLLNSFVLYFLPLLVILFSLFSTLLVSEHSTNPLRILGPYTGLFFALVILQRSVRETYPTGSTLYIEYAFFYTYLTIILLVLHTILTHYYGKHPDHKYYRNIVFPLIKLVFWPLQLAAWLITTLIVFY